MAELCEKFEHFFFVGTKVNVKFVHFWFSNNAVEHEKRCHHRPHFLSMSQIDESTLDKEDV